MSRTLSRKLVTGIAGTCAAGAVAATVWASLPQARAAGGCHATQPVYTSDYRLVGTWDATLRPGDEVTLPDEDVAVCQKDGSMDVQQP